MYSENIVRNERAFVLTEALKLHFGLNMTNINYS